MSTCRLKPTRRFSGRLDPLPRPLPTASPLTKLGLFGFAVTGTFCYPALNVGASTGVTLGIIMGLGVIVTSLATIPLKKLGWSYWLIVLPYLISGAIILNRPELLNARNVAVGSIAFSVSITSILLPGIYLYYNEIFTLLVGSALGFLFHTLVGAFQFVFAGNYPAIYFAFFNNNSFALANFATRPMGLFPEPSAMTATLGPLVMIVYQLVDRAARRSGQTGYVSALFIKGGCLAAVGLAVLSQSGFAPVLMLGLFGVVIYHLAVVQRRLLVALGAVAVACLGAGFLWWVMEERISSELAKSTSWQTRWDSIVAALELWSSSTERLVLGMGSNQLYLRMEQYGTYSSYGTLQRFANAFSITIIYLVETGVFGLLGLGGVVWLSVRGIWRSGNRWGGAMTFGVWALGATFTASYFNLYGIWFCLGFFPLWEYFFPKSVAQEPSSGLRL